MSSDDPDTPLIEILTLREPALYSPRQMFRAMWLARYLCASEFYLLEKPRP